MGDRKESCENGQQYQKERVVIDITRQNQEQQEAKRVHPMVEIEAVRRIRKYCAESANQLAYGHFL